MKAARQTVVALVVLLAMLMLVSWLGYVTYKAVEPTAVARPAWTDEDEEFVRAVRMRRRVHLAQIPWTLDMANPEDALVAAAGLPWNPVKPPPGPDGAGPVTLASALVPAKFPDRRAADEPLPAVLGAAGVPWTGRQLGAVPARVYLAHVPPMKRIPDPLNPDPLHVAAARLPWLREVGAIEPARVAPAALPDIPLPPPEKPATTDSAAAPKPAADAKPPAKTEANATAGRPQATDGRAPAKPTHPSKPANPSPGPATDPARTPSPPGSAKAPATPDAAGPQTSTRSEADNP